MSISTDALREKSEERLSAFDGMLKHLSIDPDPESASLFRDELHEARRLKLSQSDGFAKRLSNDFL